jgi:hypothetical protein
MVLERAIDIIYELNKEVDDKASIENEEALQSWYAP